jgi:hypothetical protein
MAPPLLVNRYRNILGLPDNGENLSRRIVQEVDADSRRAAKPRAVVK